MPRGLSIRTGAMPSKDVTAPPTFYRNGHTWQAKADESGKYKFKCVTCGGTFDNRSGARCENPTTSGEPNR